MRKKEEIEVDEKQPFTGMILWYIPYSMCSLLAWTGLELRNIDIAFFALVSDCIICSSIYLVMVVNLRFCCFSSFTLCWAAVRSSCKHSMSFSFCCTARVAASLWSCNWESSKHSLEFSAVRSSILASDTVYDSGGGCLELALINQVKLFTHRRFFILWWTAG